MWTGLLLGFFNKSLRQTGNVLSSCKARVQFQLSFLKVMTDKLAVKQISLRDFSFLLGNHLSIIALYSPITAVLMCPMALTRRHLVTSSVLKCWAPSLAWHFPGCRLRKKVLRGYLGNVILKCDIKKWVSRMRTGWWYNREIEKTTQLGNSYIFFLR
jgi:hypothetical protein